VTPSLRPLLVLGLAGALASGPAVALADSKGGGTGHNPAGNNGTVKIGSVPLDGGHGNDAHVGCSFALRFYGFDRNQTADITFTGQAPTKTGTLLRQSAVRISDDDAGGGQDADAVLFYSVDQLGLSGVPQASQGWHVKVAVDVIGAPGGSKQKVFWISCPGQSGSTSKPASGGGAGQTAPAGRTTANTSTTTHATAAIGTAGTTTPGATGTTTTTPRSAAGSGTARTSASTYGDAKVSADSLAPATLGSDNRTSGGGGVGRGGLPFTGFALGGLLTAALGALGLGTAAVAIGRRKRA